MDLLSRTANMLQKKTGSVKSYMPTPSVGSGYDAQDFSEIFDEKLQPLHKKLSKYSKRIGALEVEKTHIETENTALKAQKQALEIENQRLRTERDGYRQLVDDYERSPKTLIEHFARTKGLEVHTHVSKFRPYGTSRWTVM
jgi:regulator of replication initiation timing